MRRWWRRRSLRLRLTLIATAALAVGIAAGGVLLLRGFATSRVHAIDVTSRTVAANLTALVEAGALPQILPVNAGQSAQVITATGGVVAASPGTLRTLPLVPTASLDRLARTGPASQQVSTVTGQGTSRVRVERVSSNGTVRYVVIAVSLADERDTIAGLSHVVLIGAPILLLIVATTLWVLLGSALGAVTDLRKGAESIADPSAGERLPVPASRDEIHYLATTLNRMIDRLAAAHDREGSFIADAAHELRSPVAALRTQLEMALATPDGRASCEFTEGALRDTERLSDLIQDLLALAGLQSTPIACRDLVDLSDLVGVPGNRPYLVSGDAASLMRAIDNLRSNAARHAVAQVHLSISSDDNLHVDVHVDDDGPGIPPDQRDRIFERFVRLDMARARDDGGAGLGLAIVAATAHAHGGTVTVTDSPLGGARFTLTLPLAAGSSTEHGQHTARTAVSG